MCNSLVGYTQSHLCQPTEHKGWDSPQLQSPAHSTNSFISFWFTRLSCQLTLQLVHMCLLKPEWTGHLQLIMTFFHMFAFFLLWLISVVDPESVWWGSVVGVDRPASIFPRRGMCGNWWLLLFFFSSKNLMEYFIYLIPGCHLSSSLKYSLNAPCLMIALHSFFTCCLTQWCLEPNHVSCCNRKINTYILLFQTLVFWYLWQILYSTPVLICQHFKINTTLEMEWLCESPMCHSDQSKLFLLKLNLDLNMSGIKAVSEVCIHSIEQ